jgi:hypothetical protein
MRRIALAVVLGVALLAPVGSPAAVEAAQSVTLTFARFYSNVCNCWSARASGQISSGAAGQEVVILKQNCGRSFGTADAAATTREGGVYETEVRFIPFEGGNFSAIYRARWNGQLSPPVIIRGRLIVVTRKLPGRRRQVVVSTLSANPVNLKGRQVVLQREVGGAWTRIAGARLTPHPVKYYTFVATFTVRQRGWKLRALVPAKSAAPCFTASPSERWTS